MQKHRHTVNQVVTTKGKNNSPMALQVRHGKRGAADADMACFESRDGVDTTRHEHCLVTATSHRGLGGHAVHSEQARLKQL